MMVATLVMASNTLLEFSTLVELPKRLSILPFIHVFSGDGHQGYREQLLGDTVLYAGTDGRQCGRERGAATPSWRGAILWYFTTNTAKQQTT